MKKKLLIVGGVLIIIFVVAVIFIFSYDKENKDNNNDNNIPNENVNTNITKEQNINGIVFTNIKCDFDGSISLLEYTIVNKTGSAVNLGEYEIIVKDKDGNVLANMVGVLDEEIGPNEEVEAANTIDIDLNDADSIELVLD